jgi:hypothetical protein
MKDALDEVMSLSDKLFPPPCLLSRNTLTHLCRIIRDLIGSIVSHIGALYKASEAVSLLLYACGKFDQSRAKVALLDMLVSFAHASIGKPPTCIPRLVPRDRPLSYLSLRSGSLLRWPETRPSNDYD